MIETREHRTANEVKMPKSLGAAMDESVTLRQYLRAHVLLILGSALSFGVIAAAWIIRSPYLYRSETTLMVNSSWDMEEVNQLGRGDMIPLDVRVTYLSVSSDMLERLERRFGPKDHGSEMTGLGPSSWAQAMSERIEAIQVEPGIIRLMAYDEDPERARAIGNAIIEELRSLHRDIAEERLATYGETIEKVVARSGEMDKQRTEATIGLMKELRSIAMVDPRSMDPQVRLTMDELRSRISVAMSNLESSDEMLERTIRDHGVRLEMAGSSLDEEIIVIHRPAIKNSTSPWLVGIGRTMIAALGGAFFAVLALLFWFFHGPTLLSSLHEPRPQPLEPEPPVNGKVLR
ncbi:MAG: hypothetical protein JNN32_14490 [Flavobacteriales bacterium]|nr:hypothetical protein [Flavobacteriales bacterium]